MEDAGRRSDGHVAEKFLAGRKLLDKFAVQWEQLHRVDENNIDKSKLAIDKLNTIDRRVRERLGAMDTFSANYKALAGLKQQLNNIGCDLNHLERSFVQIEALLSQMAERNERVGCERFIREYRGNYEAQSQMAKIQTELARDRLMAEHLQRVQDFEKDQQLTMEERRKVLAREFEAEKTRYLEKATSDRKDR